LFAVISGGRRLASWGRAEFSAMRELALRHPSGRPATPATPATPRHPRHPRHRDTATPATPAPLLRAAPGTGAARGTGIARGAAAVPAEDGRVRFGEFVADEVSLDCG